MSMLIIATIISTRPILPFTSTCKAYYGQEIVKIAKASAHAVAAFAYEKHW